MVIWEYEQLEYSWLVSIIVLASNVEALSGNLLPPKRATHHYYWLTFPVFYLVYLDMSYAKTFVIVGLGIISRIIAQLVFLRTTFVDIGLDNSPFLRTKWLSLWYPLLSEPPNKLAFI